MAGEKKTTLQQLTFANLELQGKSLFRRLELTPHKIIYRFPKGVPIYPDGCQTGCEIKSGSLDAIRLKIPKKDDLFWYEALSDVVLWQFGTPHNQQMKKGTQFLAYSSKARKIQVNKK